MGIPLTGIRAARCDQQPQGITAENGDGSPCRSFTVCVSVRAASMDTLGVPGTVPEHIICVEEASEEDRVPRTTNRRLLDASQMRGIQQSVITSAQHLGRPTFEAQEPTTWPRKMSSRNGGQRLNASRRAASLFDTFHSQNAHRDVHRLQKAVEL